MKASTIAVAATALLLGGGVQAQERFPERPVTLVVPYGPGGSTDLLARQLATQLQEIWGLPVVVENRSGAGSMIGAAYVSQARPDGHTLLFNTSAQVTAPAIYPDLPFDPDGGITPIAMVSYSPFLMVAGSAVQSDTLAALLAEADERVLFVATAGPGSSSHFAAELFAGQSGREMEIVHYNSGGEALTDLMGGHSDLYVSSTASSMAAVSGRQVKAIGVLGTERYDALPDTEATVEVGVETPDIRIWQGVFGPGAMPEEVVRKISTDIATAVGGDAFREMLAANYTLPAETTHDLFREMVVEEMAFWRDLAAERRITAD